MRWDALVHARAPTLAVALLVLCGASACYTMRASLPGALRADLDDEAVEIVGQYEKEIHHSYLLWGLVGPPTRELVADDLVRAVDAARADGVANLLFEARFTAVDVVVTSVTLGILSPRSYRITADLVRLRAAEVPGKPLLRRDARTQGAR